MIAVTGANGLLGSFIVRKLLEENVKFIALKRSGSDTSLLADVNDSITWRIADVTNPVELLEAFSSVTHVIHTAAVVSFHPRKAKQIMDINVIGTRNVVDACLIKNIKRLVHISSVAALGRQKNQAVIDETNRWVANTINSAYAESKYYAELEVFRGQEEGLKTIILNPSIILAPANWNNSSAKLFKYVWDQNLFYTPGCINYVDVRDVSEAAYLLLNHDAENERYILNAGNITIKEFFKRIAKQFNKKPPQLEVNKTIIRMVAFLESFKTFFSAKEPLITKETAQIAGTEFLYDNKKIIGKLSFKFQPIDETLRWCCNYYKAMMELKK